MKTNEGQKINEGYEIIAEYPIIDRVFVIGYNENYVFPYVVWDYSPKSEMFYGGSYLEERDEATLEALKRLADYANYLLEEAKRNYDLYAIHEQLNQTLGLGDYDPSYEEEEEC